MIKVEITDNLTPLLDELENRIHGLVGEALQVAGSKIASASRQKMQAMSHHWFNAVVNGKYQEWYNPAATKELGARISHTDAGSISPASMASQISFYLSKKGTTVTIGGAHPRFTPIRFKHGIAVGTYGKSNPPVGSKGRAILHKLNTGEVTSENPYYGTEKQNLAYKSRHFMEAGYREALPAASEAFTNRFKEVFQITVEGLDVLSRKRRY